jgi:N6-adenosine-specific RNA methylase IME4
MRTDSDPPKKYQTAIVDPPWQHQSGEKHYMTLRTSTLAEMGSSIDRIMAPNAHLWLWVTNGTLKEGLELLEAWGWTYRSMLSWVKPRLGLGPYLRNMTEHVLLATRGNAPPRFRGQGTWLFAPMQDHSHKPEELHQIVLRFSPGPNYVELFARRPYAGFDVWGNEVRSDLEIPGWPVPNGPAARAQKEGRT